MSRSLLGLTALVAVLSLPADASAVDRFVDDEGTNAPACTDIAAPCATINHAVEQAVDGDTIFIDEGIYEEAVSTPKVLTFDGRGTGTIGETEGATIVRGPNGVGGPGAPAFSLPNGGTVRVLRAEGGDGAGGLPGFAGGPGLAFNSSGPALLRLEGALLIGGDAGGLAAGGSGLHMKGNGEEIALESDRAEFATGAGIVDEGAATVSGSATNAKFSSPLLGAFGGPLSFAGLAVMDGATASVQEGFGIAKYGAVVEEGSMTLNRTVLFSEIVGVGAVSSATGTTAKAEVRNSIVAAVKETAGMARTLPGGGSATLTAVGSTFITFEGRGVAAEGALTGGPALAVLRNTIVRNNQEEGVPPPELHADGGTIEADYSNFTVVDQVNGGTAPAPGSAHNIPGDPDFVEEGIFGQLAETSPLIDKGDPAAVEEGELDFTREARSLDGDGDCIAVPDIGAFELTGKSAPCPPAPKPAPKPSPFAPDPPPVVSGFGLTNAVFTPKTRTKRMAAKQGTQFTYTLSEAALVKITIERKVRGRKVEQEGKTRCVKATRRKAKPPCIRFVHVVDLAASEQSGKHSTPFSGLVHGRPLRPGPYRARIIATDSAGQNSEARQASFRVVTG